MQVRRTSTKSRQANSKTVVAEGHRGFKPHTLRYKAPGQVLLRIVSTGWSERSELRSSAEGGDRFSHPGELDAEHSAGEVLREDGEHLVNTRSRR